MTADTNQSYIQKINSITQAIEQTKYDAARELFKNLENDEHQVLGDIKKLVDRLGVFNYHIAEMGRFLKDALPNTNGDPVPEKFNTVWKSVEVDFAQNLSNVQGLLVKLAQDDQNLLKHEGLED